MAVKILRLRDLYNDPKRGRLGKLNSSRTKVVKDFIHRPGGPEFIKGSNTVRRLRLAYLSPNVPIVYEDEADELLEALRRERDAKLRVERVAKRDPVQEMTAD
jgi:hypothetical protein